MSPDSQHAPSPVASQASTPVAVAIRPLALAAYIGVLAVPLVLAAVVVCALLPGLAWWLGLLVGVGLAVFLAVRRLRSAHRVVFDAVVGDNQATASDRFDNLVDGLTLTAGIRRPDVQVLDTDGIGALAVSHNFQHTIIVTRRLVSSLSVVELEGVVAALMVRLRNGDAESATLATALFELPIIGDWFRPALGLVAGPVVGPLLPEARDVLADRQAVSMTRYPPGLLSALQTVQGLKPPVAGLDPRFAELSLFPDVGPDDGSEPATGGLSSITSRDRLDLRIAVLSEL